MPVIAHTGDKIDQYYLYPGKVFCSKRPHIVHTILGSCIAVFLWDPILQFGSVNHFMLPNKEGSASFKYGNVAIPEIIKRMLNMGSIKNNKDQENFWNK
jgi:chemotaxis protein CheD